MSHTNDILEQLERYLQFMKSSGVQYLPLSDSIAPPDAATTEKCTTIIASDSKEPSNFTAGSTLEEIKKESHLCTRCDLSDLKTNIVFGSGNPDADLLFIGVAPTREEEISGEPFIGDAGDLLTKIIEAIKLKREDVYLTNLIKCCTPEEENPTTEQVRACKSILTKQIMAIKPLVICALGDVAAQTLLDNKEPISSLRGLFHDYNGIPLIPTYHPSYILENPNVKREVWEDMKQIKKMIDKKA